MFLAPSDHFYCHYEMIFIKFSSKPAENKEGRGTDCHQGVSCGKVVEEIELLCQISYFHSKPHQSSVAYFWKGTPLHVTRMLQGQSSRIFTNSMKESCCSAQTMTREFKHSALCCFICVCKQDYISGKDVERPPLLFDIK